MHLLRICLFSVTLTAICGDLPDGYWRASDRDPILDGTLRLRLAPDLSQLSPAERQTVALLNELGALFHDLYMHQRHPDALSARATLLARHRKTPSDDTRALLDLFRIFKGPIATTPSNMRRPFLPVSPEIPQRNVYPPGMSAESLQAFLAQHPDRRAELMAVRSVVRRATAEQLEADRATLRAHPALALLHPGLAARLNAMSPDENTYYGLPYSVAYVAPIMEAYGLLERAAAAIEGEDADFAAYLRHRGRDLLADDYEAGDAAWITGDFENLNAQIGSYETYDDPLFGVKSFFSLSLLLRDRPRSEAMAKAIKGLQALHDSLPYKTPRKIREDIPVGVYQVIADYGQARGTNTATILPNESHIARKYGRTILLRHNIMTNPDLYAITDAAWRAAVVPAHAEDLTIDAGFNRTLFHEIGHYLGVDRDKQGRTLDVALSPWSSHMEEMKADLVSLFAVEALGRAGFYDASGMRAVRAAGIYRTLQRVEPRRGQPYQTMQLMQMNFFLEAELIRFAPDGRLAIDYGRYQETVAAMLKRVLELQHGGDPAAVEQFIDTYFQWDERHQKLAELMGKASPYRYRLVTYAALDE